MSPQTGCTADNYYVKTRFHSETFANSSAFEGWDIEYTQLSAGKYECQSQEVGLHGLQIFTETGNATVNQVGAAWPNSYVFGIPCRMEYEGRTNGRRWLREIAAFRGENEFDVLVPPMKLLVVVISREILADYLWTVEHVAIGDWLRRGMLFVDSPEHGARAAEVLPTLVEGCCADASLLAYPQARSAVMQTAMGILAPLMLDNLAPPPPAYGEFSRMQIVRRAREFALENIDESLQIIDVCRALGVCRATLQYSFRDVLNVNPVAYLKLLRLNGARRDLLKADEKPIQVKDVVARWGFWHLSRFSAEYKQMFHELPSETLRQAQKSATQM